MNKVKRKYNLRDLDLPKLKIVKLKDIIFSYNQFGKKLIDRTKRSGVIILFTGNNLTGKIMAARVLTNELNLNLRRIDLRLVVSKYIGETEKNLSKIFKEAEKSNSILFFDEADALFGKRSEVKDSHDRYANIEVSYLLQQIEAYPGLIILAANKKSSLDDAFLRRIRFVVSFPFPQTTNRNSGWNLDA